MPGHPDLSIVRQCELVSKPSRASMSTTRICFRETAENLALMRLIDVQFLETPWIWLLARWPGISGAIGHEVGRQAASGVSVAMMGDWTPIYRERKTQRTNGAELRAPGLACICSGAW